MVMVVDVLIGGVFLSLRTREWMMEERQEGPSGFILLRVMDRGRGKKWAVGSSALQTLTTPRKNRD